MNASRDDSPIWFNEAFFSKPKLFTNSPLPGRFILGSQEVWSETSIWMNKLDGNLLQNEVDKNPDDFTLLFRLNYSTQMTELVGFFPAKIQGWTPLSLV